MTDATRPSDDAPGPRSDASLPDGPAPAVPEWLRGAVDQVRATPVPPETVPAMDFRP